jgi:alpha-ketoglutarate-dependent taurine dioxygenase
MKDRLLAFGWFCYLAGVTVCFKEVHHKTLVEQVTLLERFGIIFVFGGSMLMAYLAGKEQEKSKKDTQ